MSEIDYRFEILKIELTLLQSRFDKYDDLIFRSRQWALVLWVACIGLLFKDKVAEFSIIIKTIPVMFFILEGLLRYFYWYKYVTRYRKIRNSLNEDIASYNEIPLYDLTNHYEFKSDFKKRFKSSFVKPDCIFFYGLLFVASFAESFL